MCAAFVLLFTIVASVCGVCLRCCPEPSSRASRALSGAQWWPPDLPVWVMYVGSIFQNFTLLVGILVIGREILSIPLRIIGLPFPFLGRNRIVAGTILGLSVAFSCLGMFKSVISLEVVEQEVAVKDLPVELDGLRIAQLSDLHVSSVFTRDRVEEIVERTNALKPDLIALTGDFVDGTPQKRGYDLEHEYQ